MFFYLQMNVFNIYVPCEELYTPATFLTFCWRNKLIVWCLVEVMRIEHLLRRGQRQLASLQKSTTTGVGLFQSQDDNNQTSQQPLEPSGRQQPP